MFKEERDSSRFAWKDLGNIDEGRPNLGPTTSVAAYRLMQYTLRDILIRRIGVEKTNEVLYEAGYLSGSEFCKNMLDTSLSFDAFISDVSDKLLKLNIGIMRFEVADLEKMKFMITISEDLDCSGLPMSNETVCNYDEGFIAGILHIYTGKDFNVKEIDCWASGERHAGLKPQLKSRGKNGRNLLHPAGKDIPGIGAPSSGRDT